MLKLLIILCMLLLASNANENISFLNQEEQKWLKKLEVPLKVGITEIPNQVLNINNKYEGFSIDMFNKIELLLNVKFEYVYFKTWDELIVAGNNREIDIIFSAQKTKNRLTYYDFTDPVLRQKNKIIVALNKSTSLSIEDFFGKKMALVNGSAIFEYLKFNYPKIILVPTKSEEEALIMVTERKVNATISEVIRAGYYIKKSKNTNLHIAGDIKYDYNLRIASRNDSPMLSVILSKTIEIIPKKYMETLQLKWGYIKETNYEYLWRVVIGSLILSAFILLWVGVLRRENRKQGLILSQQSRLAQMGEVINMIAHQWRQPLATINALVMVMDIKLSKENGLDKALLEKEFNEIELTTLLMSRTIDDFRDFFKPEKEKIKFNMEENIEHAIRLVQPVLNYDGISMHKSYKDKRELLGYPNEIGQVIVNIINNAKDVLNINNKNREKNIYISLFQKNNNVVLTIEDNAGGIDKEIIGHIFDPYFSTKSKKNGTGLGLYISKMIIEEHMGGKLSVINSDIGAIFTLTFPITL